MRRPRFVQPSQAVARGLPVALLMLGAACADSTPSSPRAVETPMEVTDALRMDAGELAKDTGMSLHEAIAVLALQPRVGRLQATLKSEGPEVYGGIFMEYEPEYRIVLLSLPGGGVEAARAVDELGYGDLSPFVDVRETPYTEDVLEEAERMVAKLGGNKVTTLSQDIHTGEIRATVASKEDADVLTAALDAADPPVPAPVVVTVPKPRGVVRPGDDIAANGALSVVPARLEVGDRAEFRVGRRYGFWGPGWVVERKGETSWEWVGNLRAGPGRLWSPKFFVGRPAGFEDIGFTGPFSRSIKIPKLDADRYRLGQALNRGGRDPSEQRRVWHFAEFEVVE